MQIVWAEPKRQSNLAKHGMDFADLSLDFFATAVIVSANQNRLIAIGRLNGATLVVFVELGSEALSVVSMRPASQKERKLL